MRDQETIKSAGEDNAHSVKRLVGRHWQRTKGGWRHRRMHHSISKLGHIWVLTLADSAWPQHEPFSRLFAAMAAGAGEYPRSVWERWWLRPVRTRLMPPNDKLRDAAT